MAESILPYSWCSEHSNECPDATYGLTSINGRGYCYCQKCGNYVRIWSDDKTLNIQEKGEE